MYIFLLLIFYIDFFYREKLYHTNIVFHENGTMTYVATRTPVFLQEMNNISLNETIIVANIAVLVC